MNTLLTIAIMCLVGYCGFVFIAENPNPVHRSKLKALRSRHKLGRLVGGLIALSSIVALFVPGNLLSKLKASLLVAATILLLLIFVLSIKFAGNWILRKLDSQSADKVADDDSGKNEQVIPASVAQTIPPRQQRVPADSSSGISPTPREDRTAPHLLEMGEPNEENPADEIPSPQTSTGTYRLDHTSDVQNNRPETVKKKTEPPFISVQAMEANKDGTANTEVSNTYRLNSHNEVVADDFFEPRLSNPESSFSPNHQLQNGNHFEVPDDNNHEDAGSRDSSQLESAVKTASKDAEHIQQAVLKINELRVREKDYRRELSGVRTTYEKALETQHESVAEELRHSHLQLDVEKLRGEELELSLTTKGRALFDAEARVIKLEKELHERQEVFSNQMQSLAKTKTIARDAALLARRAAVAQQRAHASALKERAARERLEISTKRAVDIARNAITKLAEEERKNSASAGLH